MRPHTRMSCQHSKLNAETKRGSAGARRLRRAFNASRTSAIVERLRSTRAAAIATHTRQLVERISVFMAIDSERAATAARSVLATSTGIACVAIARGEANDGQTAPTHRAIIGQGARFKAGGFVFIALALFIRVRMRSARDPAPFAMIDDGRATRHARAAIAAGSREFADHVFHWSLCCSLRLEES